MGRLLGAGLCQFAFLVGLAAGATRAEGQHPLCPAPSAEDSYYFTCRAGNKDQVARFLHDFSVRHLLRSEDRFEIPTDVLLQAFGLDTIFDPSNPSVKAMLERRPKVEFIPLDRSTGEFVSKIVEPKNTPAARPAPTPSPTKGPETLTVANERIGVTLEITLPEVVQGLYWRSPAHLELQFYKGHNIGFHLSGRNIEEYEEGLECISITASRARATTADPLHRYLMSFYEGCP